METKIREMQLKLLAILAPQKTTFALAGGTALELYYLGHRFSRDLDLFSPTYNLKEVDKIVALLSKGIGKKIKLEGQFISSNHAQVQFYVMPVEGSSFPLKIDFVEDVIFDQPEIKRFNRVPVYAAKQIYFQKILAIVGTRLIQDSTGREITGGRGEIRDVIDLYYLSQKIEPLHLFLKDLPREYQRGIIQWYHSFSRQEFKLGFLDFDIYDKTLDSSRIISHLEAEIKKFLEGELK